MKGLIFSTYSRDDKHLCMFYNKDSKSSQNCTIDGATLEKDIKSTIDNFFPNQNKNLYYLDSNIPISKQLKQIKKNHLNYKGG